MAVPLVMADLTRHVLQDYGYIDLPMFNANPHCNSPTMKCLSLAGWVRLRISSAAPSDTILQFFTVFFTYSGYTLLITGVLWAADICIKIRAAIRKTRK